MIDSHSQESLTLSVVILTYCRDAALKNTLSRLVEVMGTTGYELVLVDNNTDKVDRKGMISEFTNSRYVCERCNTGVASGRNLGIAASTGDVILFLDDDALLDPSDFFQDRLLARFAENDTLGVVGFRSFVGKDRIEDRIEFPHTDKTKDRGADFDTFRFIGVAHAIRRSAFVAVGGYCPAFFYGMEEFDLSYRLLKLGYKIEYRPTFSVQHMKENAGRLPSKAVIQRMYANKMAVGWMHLPIKQFSMSVISWFVKTAIDARSLVVPMKSIGDFIAMAAHGQIKRRVPSKALVFEIKRLGGTAWR